MTSSTMNHALEQLLNVLDLKQSAPYHFQGINEDFGLKAIFGGQVCAQAMIAAYRTVHERVAHSMHAYFIRPGNYESPIDFEVQIIRDGGSFSVRRVIARQEDNEIFTMSASFQSPEDGFNHQVDIPQHPEPDILISELDLRRRFQHLIPEHLKHAFTRDRPIEIRPVNPINYIQPDLRPPYKQSLIRAQGALNADISIHHALLAYATDLGLLSTSLLPHGVSFASKNMQIASLDHAIWFHRDFDMADWLLYDMDSPSSSGGRGYNRGNIFNLEGKLVASVAQEALIRKTPDTSK